MSTTSDHRLFRAAVINALDIHGFLTAPQLGTWTGTQLTDEAMRKRLSRMEAEGLIERRLVRADNMPSVPCWTLTAQGHALTSGCLERVDEIGSSTARHHLVTAQVAIELQLAGVHVSSERELRFEEKEGRASSGYRERGHWPDSRWVRVWPDGRVVRHSEDNAIHEWFKAWTPKFRADLRVNLLGPGSDPWDATPVTTVAVEVELSKKAKQRLLEKLAWYSTSASGYSRVVYLCGDPAVARAIQCAAEQAAPTLDLRVAVLAPEFLDAAVSRRRGPNADLAIAPDLVGLLRLTLPAS